MGSYRVSVMDRRPLGFAVYIYIYHIFHGCDSYVILSVCLNHLFACLWVKILFFLAGCSTERKGHSMFREERCRPLQYDQINPERFSGSLSLVGPILQRHALQAETKEGK